MKTGGTGSRRNAGYSGALHQGDGGGIDDVVYAAAPGKIADRFREPLEERAVSLRSRKALYQFIPDIARLKIGKHKDIRFSRYRRPGGFLFPDGRDNGGVELELTVHENVGTPFLHDFQGLDDLVDIRMGSRTLSGER